MAQTPNQRIRRDCTIELSSGDFVPIDKGSLVKVVRKEYLSKHPEHPFGDYNEEYKVAIFTKFGMAIIERDLVDWSVY